MIEGVNQSQKQKPLTNRELKMIYTVITRVWSKTYRQMMTTDFDGVAFTTLGAAKAHANWAAKNGSIYNGKADATIKSGSEIIATVNYKKGKLA